MTMKYFTPDLWIRFQDVSDEQTFLANSAEWEEAVAAYQSEIADIKARLPKSLRRFLDSGSLHDAALTGMWRTRRRLTLLVRPEPPSDRYVLLAYTLVEEPKVNPTALPQEHRTEQATWMYDELGVERGLGGRHPPEDTYVHSILLSNGQEITIRFRRFDFSWREALFPIREEPSEYLHTSASRSA